MVALNEKFTKCLCDGYPQRQVGKQWHFQFPSGGIFLFSHHWSLIVERSADASRNVSQATDPSASITTALAYDTFGVITDNSGPQNPTVAWQGKQGYQFEQPLGAAGLQYVRQRWYDPATQQFISPDPLGLPDATVPWGIESGQISGGDVNLFRYAGNDPGGEQFGDNFNQMSGGFSFLGPLVPSAPLQNSLGVQSPHTVQRAIIAHMPAHTSAERLAKQEALRSLNEPIDVASLGRLFTALIGFPFVLAYEGGKSSYHQAVANTTVLATRHLEHGGSPIGAGAEAISYNMLSWLGIKNALESGTGATLVHPHRLSTPQRVIAAGLGALQFGTLAIPEIREFLPGLGGSARVDAAVLRSTRVGEGVATTATWARRWFYDPREFSAISREYWAEHGPAAGRSLHHWLFPQRWKWVPVGFRNAGVNLLELPEFRGLAHPRSSLNAYMGLAPRWKIPMETFKAGAWEWGIRVVIPTAPVGFGYGGYRVGKWLITPDGQGR